MIFKLIRGDFLNCRAKILNLGTTSSIQKSSKFVFREKGF